MSIAIVGSEGWVGKHMKKLMKTFIAYDEPLNIGSKEEVNDCSAAFVCVPTPMSEDGSCDISIIEDVLSWLKTPLVILRSTVPPGTTDILIEKYKIEIVMNPEYIGETVSHPLNNVGDRDFVVLGGLKKSIGKAIHVYHNFYNASVRFFQCSAKEAELIKYCENSFIGTYVTFCNEFYNICKGYDVDWSTVREGFLMDPRMTPFWTFVFPHDRGFGGKCIPKDMNAIFKASSENGYTPKFIGNIIARNDEYRDENV
jgi:UDPglucose 6-dehydrogenase